MSPTEENKKRILVIGDVMLDRYWWGDVDRISPEAPVPVVEHKRTTSVAGGAANVAANVYGAGSEPVLIGMIGADSEAEELKGCIVESSFSAGYLIEDSARPTSVKTRIVAGGQQVVRVDREVKREIAGTAIKSVVSRIDALIETADVVILSDYAKGLLSVELVGEVLQKARTLDIPVLVDPKGKDYRKYRGAFLITPNQKEALDAAALDGTDEAAVDQAGFKLIEECGVERVLITRGKDGMRLFGADTDPHSIDADARRVFDVTGAGDTVIAVLASVLANGESIESACRKANRAAGVVVERLGTSPIRIEDFELWN